MLRILLTALSLSLLTGVQATHYPGYGLQHDDQQGLSLNGVPATTRIYWMRMASKAVAEVRGDPCSRFHFGAVVVNTTSDELVCISANQVSLTGNPTLHGEIAALNRCTEVLSERGLSPFEILESWKDLSMYTTGEPCSMCSSALRWAGMKEVIWATSIETVVKNGYPQIYLPSSAIVAASYSLPSHTAWYGSILRNETDPYFEHFFNESAPCPHSACERVKEEGSKVSGCQVKGEWREEWEGRKGVWEEEMMRTRGHPGEFEGETRGHDEL
ncbi:hypothetical protein JCM16303_002833 [Sporobolomyces ruberrimus]